MSIAEMRKVSLCGPAAETRDALAGLQELGCVHLVPLADGAGAAEGPAEAREVREALGWLEQAPHLRRPLRAEPAFDLEAVTRRTLEIRDRQRAVRDRRDFLEGRAASLRPWGDFALPPLEALDGHRLWFYEVPHRRGPELAEVALPWAEVARSPSTRFVVVISPTEPPPGAMPVPRTHTGPHSLAAVERALEDAEIELEDLELERIALTRYIRLIRKNLARADDGAALARAVAGARETAGLFAVEGWAPVDRMEAVERFAGERGLALLAAPPGEEETPPTRLDNALPAAAGEDLARFYQIPGPRDWDPSGVLAASFAAFFAMVLSDAGYGLVVLLAAAALWPRLGGGPQGRRLRVLALALGAAAVLYGIAAGSYFGLPPPAGTLPAALVLLDPRDPATMMTVSIAIGVFHVALGSAAIVWRRWPDPRARAALGWIAVALGGFVAWRGHAAGAGEIRGLGLALAALGLAGVVLFRGRHRLDGASGLLRRAGEGLLGLGLVPQMFGDVLSYLRLFALGLASASLAVTFNGLSADLAAGTGGPGLLLAILVALVGHGLNFALAVVGGVVHGLRLNFIEFYNWGLVEEGYAFRPLERKEIRV
jgi:V/A-type H+-transporting ATPase subunit I